MRNKNKEDEIIFQTIWEKFLKLQDISFKIEITTKQTVYHWLETYTKRPSHQET